MPFGQAPNVSGLVSGGVGYYEQYASGCFFISDSQPIEGTTKGSLPGTFRLDLSRSSAIYGKSSKVQPSAFQLLMIIKA